jgi:hypothetical protein
MPKDATHHACLSAFRPLLRIRAPVPLTMPLAPGSLQRLWAGIARQDDAGITPGLWFTTYLSVSFSRACLPCRQRGETQEKALAGTLAVQIY